MLRWRVVVLGAVAIGLGACQGTRVVGEERVRLGNTGQVLQPGATAGTSSLAGRVKAPRSAAAYRLAAVRTEPAAAAKVVAYDDGGIKLAEVNASSTGAFTFPSLPSNEPLRLEARVPEGVLVAFGRAFDGAPEVEIGPGSTAVAAWLLSRTGGKLLSFDRASMLAAAGDVESQVEAADFRAAWGQPADLAALVEARRKASELLPTLMAGLESQLAREGFAAKAEAGASPSSPGSPAAPERPASASP